MKCELWVTSQSSGSQCQDKLDISNVIITRYNETVSWSEYQGTIKLVFIVHSDKKYGQLVCVQCDSMSRYLRYSSL